MTYTGHAVNFTKIVHFILDLPRATFVLRIELFEPFLYTYRYLISVASNLGQRRQLRLVRSMRSFVQSLGISRSDSSTVTQRMMSGDVPRNHSCS